ncbi:MAG: DNA polymerase III subunit gamma/tau [Candidatus Staskawiczbacteria bacterium]|nr:DNA polymerase III subunit gamma/tau [Candidatus Staskawiczbacteria bacterium]
MSPVLYRKYRPQSFSEIIGQDHIVQTLANSILASNISHAYLFSGPRGSGKTTTARVFAKAINCSQNGHNEKTASFEPCNKCNSCLEIMAQKSIDLIEIDAASHTGVDDVRALIDGIRFSPVNSKYKVFIIDECHQLSKSAANALLKTLEEPPSHVIFLLATTEIHKMIPTILSRCQRFDFKRLRVPEIIKKLEFISRKENIKFEDSALSLIALNSRGSFRDAESLLDECVSFSGSNSSIKTDDIKDILGLVEISQISQFVDLLISKNTKEALLFLNSMADNGIDLQEFAKTMIFYLRQCLLLKLSPDLLTPQLSGLSEEELQSIKKQTESLQHKNIESMLKIFIEAESKMKYSAILQLPLELAVVDITYPES